MANSKKRCTNCKCYFKAETMKIVPAGNFCKVDCLLDYANNSTDRLIKKANQLERRKDSERRQVFNANDSKLRKKSAQDAFNKYIRLRDSKEPCISCKRHHTGQYHAGHYKTTGARSDLRFNEDNCHKQCSTCNNHLSGNIEHYRPNLIGKIGLERVEALDVQEVVKWTCEMYQEVEDKYKLKIKLMGD